MQTQRAPLSEHDRLLGSFAGARIYAACKSTARNRLSGDDEYFLNQCDFDRQARAGISPGIVDSDTLKRLYIGYVENQIVEWDDFELKALKQIVGNMNLRYRQVPWFQLPPIVYLVKTTGYEEGAAAYTRQTDTIVLPANMVSSIQQYKNDGDPLHPAHSTSYLQSIVTHESFHVFSKYASAGGSGIDGEPLLAIKKRLYESIGYQMIENEVALPAVKWPYNSPVGPMNQFRITNPDSPRLASYIELDTPIGAKQKLMPLLMASGAYEGGAFFHYLMWLTMAIEQHDGQWQPILDGDGRPVLYDMNAPVQHQMKEDYLSLVGYNLSGEIFQADEVLAQNFVKLLTRDLPSPRILADISAAFGGMH